MGYTVTLTFEKRPVAVTLSAATLTLASDGGGSGVQVMSFRPGHDDHLNSTVAMIPYSPLAAGTYEVRFAGTVDFGQGPAAYDERWSFTTVGASPPPVQPQPQPQPGGQLFSDVSPDHPAAGAIAHLVSVGAISGYPDGTYRPSSQVTRAEFAKLVVEAAGWTRGTGEPPPFADSAGHWAAQLGYIQAAVRAGAINGFPDGTFRPQDPVTRAQALKMAAAACGLREEPAPPGGYPYADVHGGLWYAGWTQSARAAGLIGGAGRWPLWTSAALHGDTHMTRAEAALLISNLLSR
ncbi:MAG: S-layer homology domain-containing protein [Bacillota bacterium]|nr:S-layer homology domain-containing protein [Bacillota bacterium]